MRSDLLLSSLAPIVWGTSYIVSTELMPPGRPLLTATLRALPVGIALTVWARRLPDRDWLWRVALLGTLNIGAFFALLFVAAYRLPGGVAATAGAVQPLVVAALAAVVLGERFRLRSAIAGMTGVVGVALLVLTPRAALDRAGVAAAVAATICMAFGVVLTKRWGRPATLQGTSGLMTMVGWQLLAGGLVLAPLALVVEGAPPAFTAANLAGSTWLAVPGTAMAYAVWFRGIDRLPVSALTFLGLLSPLVATVVGWLVLDEALTGRQLLGAALVATAVVLPQLRLRTRRRPPTTPTQGGPDERSQPTIGPWVPAHAGAVTVASMARV